MVRRALALWRASWWAVIALSTLLSLGGALLWSAAQPLIYQATAIHRLWLPPAPEITGFAGGVIFVLRDPHLEAQVAQIYCTIATSPVVRASAYRVLGAVSDSETAAYEAFCAPTADVSLLRLRVWGPDPNRAMQVNQAIGYDSIAQIRDLFPPVTVEVLEPASAQQTPVFPDHRLHAVLGGAVGFLMGVALVLALDLLATEIERHWLRPNDDRAGRGLTQ